MEFYIGINVQGEVYARSTAKCVRVWRLSELLGNGITADQLEGMGYCPVRKRFPGCTFRGYKRFREPLYTTTIDRSI